MKKSYKTILAYTLLFVHICHAGVIGALDGTHVQVMAPLEHQAEYLNRKMTNSVNVQAICTSKKCITYVTAGYPGSAHNARVFDVRT